FSGTTAGGAEAMVANAVKRKEILYESGREFEFILTEAALRFRLAPAGVMAAQLGWLLDLSGLANITVRIIPFTADLPVTPLHGFLIAGDDVVVETYASDIVVPPGERAAYPPVADALAAAAVTGDAARELITAAARALEVE